MLRLDRGQQLRIEEGKPLSLQATRVQRGGEVAGLKA